MMLILKTIAYLAKQFTLWVKLSADSILNFFPQKIVFDVSYKLSLIETICMKCQSLFYRKKIRKILSHCHLLNMPR